MNPVAVPVPAHHHLSGRSRRRLVVTGLSVAALVGGGIGVGILTGLLPNPAMSAQTVGRPERETGAAEDVRPVVKVIRPKRDPSVQITVEDPAASVEPYFRADLRVRASGLVRNVFKNIGDPVRKGDLLVDVDVPDLERDVAQKEAVVTQRLREFDVARAKWKEVTGAREVAKAGVKQREAEEAAAESTRDFRKMRYERFQVMAKRGSLPEGALDEEERDYKASQAVLKAAGAAVERARADYAEAGFKIEAAAADMELSRAMIDVARADRDKTRSVADYAKVVAPFDGVVVRRTVDPGSFVQNATTGATEPLISIARTDLVTVVARLPDNAASYVKPGMVVSIRVDEIPGVGIRGRVTRTSPVITTVDRTIRVEVDLFTGPVAAYGRYRDTVVAGQLAAVGWADPLIAFAVWQCDARKLAGLAKGDDDPLADRVTSDRPLLPGMTASARVTLDRFGDAYVLPSTAVYTRGGKPYILVVRDGRTRQLPVKVQVDDGRTAKVALVQTRADVGGSSRTHLVELDGSEVVVATRQVEVGDGVAVEPAMAAW